MQGSSVASQTPVASAAAFAAGSATASERRLSPFDRWAVTALLVLQLGLRIGLATQQRFNADEPQHYHVAWGWSRGLLPYRDLFENHTPLFHLLASPLVVLFGDHPDVLVWARWAMIPVAAISLAAGRSEFTLALPGRYAMLSPFGSPAGALDGKQMTEPRQLDAGAHVVDGAAPALPLALLWADAAERGLSPFFSVEPQ